MRVKSGHRQKEMGSEVAAYEVKKIVYSIASVHAFLCLFVFIYHKQGSRTPYGSLKKPEDWVSVLYLSCSWV